MVLVIATCQFPVDADIRRNLQYILKQMTTARQRGARISHFAECALSGYAGADFDTYDGFDWELLESCTRRVFERAGELGIWVVLGSSHRLSGEHKPHNSVYVVNDAGQIVDRYDKRFCAGHPDHTDSELAHYSPGNHACVFEIDGVQCGVLICHEYRYPELYREYRRLGSNLVFHSFHAGHFSPRRMKDMRNQVGVDNAKMNGGSTLPEITMPAAMHAAASANHLWISCSNTSARESCWPSFVVRPDGVVVGRLRKHTAGVLCTEIDDARQYYDSTEHWRERAMRGVLHSGELVRDRRSDDRKSL